jgi:hypothetical protein
MSNYWCWTKDKANGYNSASAYAALVSRRWEEEMRPGDDELHFLKLLWKLKAPLRVQILVWQLAQDRLPTKVNLISRNIISDS